MQLKIKDLQTSKEILINDDGVVIGRKGGKADIEASDKTVSSRHAKLYAQGQVWYIEDLDSSNGTLIQNKKITQPVIVKIGMQFVLSRYRYEVVDIITDLSAERTSIEENPMTNGQNKKAKQKVTPSQATADKSAGKGPAPGSSQRRNTPEVKDIKIVKPRPRPAKQQKDMTEPIRDGQRDSVPDSAKESKHKAGIKSHGTASIDESEEYLLGEEEKQEYDDSPRPPSKESDITQSDEGLGVIPKPGSGEVAAEVRGAAGYYLAAIPLLLFSPLRTIKKNIANQKSPVSGPLALIFYAILAIFIVALSIGFVSYLSGPSTATASAIGMDEADTIKAGNEAVNVVAQAAVIARAQQIATAIVASRGLPVDANSDDGATNANPVGAISYVEYKQRRDFIEQSIDNDPTLLLKIKDFKKLYQNLHKQEIKLGRKYKVRLGKKPSPEKLSKAKLNEKLLAIDIYMKTSNMVDRMYRQIIQQQ